MIHLQSRRAALALLAASLLHAQALAAQLAPARDTSATPSSHAQLFTARDAALAAGFAGLTVAMFPLDKTIARRLEHDTTIKNFTDRGATAVELISVPGAYILAPALYAYGRVTHHQGIQDLGLHSTEAIVLASGVTGVLKGLLGRSRPFVTRDSNPHDFHFGKGFLNEDLSALPSGHTTVAFAAASSVTSELAHLWPGHTWIVAPVMYGGATLVGIGRMYHDKHWASDIALAAGIGMFSGLKVVKYAHDHPDNYVDRMLLHASIAPDGHGGGSLAWTVPVRP